MIYRIDKNLELIPIKNRFKPLSVLLAVAIITMAWAYFFKDESVRTIYQIVHPKQIDAPSDIELTEEGIVKCLHENGCVLSNVALAQARLESNLGNSNVGKKAKNMFGIVHHKCKYVSGKYGVYAKYETYEDNIKCYIHIQDYYLKNIDGKYAEDKTYIGKIKSLK
jgi:hypothetical protein